MTQTQTIDIASPYSNNGESFAHFVSIVKDKEKAFAYAERMLAGETITIKITDELGEDDCFATAHDTTKLRKQMEAY